MRKKKIGWIVLTRALHYSCADFDLIVFRMNAFLLLLLQLYHICSHSTRRTSLAKHSDFASEHTEYCDCVYSIAPATIFPRNCHWHYCYACEIAKNSQFSLLLSTNLYPIGDVEAEEEEEVEIAHNIHNQRCARSPISIQCCFMLGFFFSHSAAARANSSNYYYYWIAKHQTRVCTTRRAH